MIEAKRGDCYLRTETDLYGREQTSTDEYSCCPYLSVSVRISPYQSVKKLRKANLAEFLNLSVLLIQHGSCRLCDWHLQTIPSEEPRHDHQQTLHLRDQNGESQRL